MDRLKNKWNVTREIFFDKVIARGDGINFSILASIGFLVFGHSFFYDFFIFDDNIFVTNNSLVENADIFSLLKAWVNSRTPVVYNVWQMISILFGIEEAFPYRLVNICFHIINSFGLFVVARELIRRIYPSWAKNAKQLNFSLLIGALFFLVHPLQAESVIWISSFKGTLAASFGILSLLFYLLSRRQEESEKSKYVFIALSFVTYMSGLLCKPSIVTLPLIYIVLDALLYNIKGVKLAIYNFCYFFSVLLISLIHMLNPSQSSGVIAQEAKVKVLLILETFRFSVLKVISPFSYSFDYQLTPSKLMEMFKSDLIGTGWILVLFYLIFSMLLIYLWHKKKNIILTGILMYFSFYLVNSGLVSFIFQNISTVANRYQYMPLIGFSLIIVSVIYNSMSWKRNLIKLISILGIVFLLCRGVYEGQKWKTSYSLLSDSYSNHKDSYPLNIALGALAQDKVKYKEAQQFFETAYSLDGGKYYLESNIRLLEIYGKNNEVEKGNSLIEEAQANLSDKSGEIETAALRFYIETDQFLKARDMIAQAEHFTKKNPGRATEVKTIKKRLGQIFFRTNQETFRQLGMEYYNQKKYKQALIWISRANELHSEEKLTKFKKYLEYKVDQEKNAKAPSSPK